MPSAKRTIVTLVPMPWMSDGGDVHPVSAGRFARGAAVDGDCDPVREPTTLDAECDARGVSSAVGATADLEFHAIGVAEEQRPVVAEPLDLADLLRPGSNEARLDHLQRVA